MRPNVEKHGKSYRVRTRVDGERVLLGSGFATKDEAEAHGWEQILKMGRGEWIDPRRGEIRLIDWVKQWLPAQELTLGSHQQYLYLFRTFILPSFGSRTLTSLTYADHEINAWEKRIRSAYAVSTARQARGRLSNALADAVVRQLISRNPAIRLSGRGSIEERRLQERRTKTATDEGWTTPLGALLIAERMALLSGRDDEFIFGIVAPYMGLRLGEMFGLERTALKFKKLHVDWQLYKLNNGSTIRKVPKDGSVRELDCPDHVARLLRHQMRSLPRMPDRPATCPCVKVSDPEYRKKYGHPVGVHIFRGLPAQRSRSTGVLRVADIAAHAGVSTGTVSNAINRPERISEATRLRVEQALAELGQDAPDQLGRSVAAHHNRDGFRSWIVTPAVTGWYPAKSPQPARPVPVIPHGWTGRPARGRNSASLAQMGWLPVAETFTPHSWRHSHKTWMEDDDIHSDLQNDRLGHVDHSVQATYTHITERMREKLLRCLDSRWEESLRARAQLWPSSHVSILDGLLEPYRHRYQRYFPVSIAPTTLCPQGVPTGNEKARYPDRIASS